MNTTTVSLNRRHLLQVSGASILGASVATQPTTAQQSDSDLNSSTGEYSRIQAPLLGMTAEEVSFGNESTADIITALAAEISNTRTTDVIVRRGTDSKTVEITDPDITASEFAEALDSGSYNFDTIRDGVTQTTRDETISVIGTRFNQAGISNYSVSQNNVQGEWFIAIVIPETDRQEAINLIENRGSVRIDVYHDMAENGEYVTDRNVISNDDFASISNARQGRSGIGPNVPVVIAESEARRVQSSLVETGVAQRGGSQCRYGEQPNATDPCLLLVSDGEIINSFGMNPALANSMRSGEWAQSPSFILTTSAFEEAQDIALNLRSGELPAELDIDAIDVTSIEAPEEITDRENNGDETEETTDKENNGDETEETVDVTPGFGIPAAITAFSGAGYLLQQRLSGSESDDE